MKERRSAVYRCLRGATLAACCAGAGGVARAAGDDGTTTVGGHAYRFPDGAFADGIVERGRQHDILLRFDLPNPAGLPSYVADADTVLVLALGGQDGASLTRDALAADIMQEAKAEASFDIRKHGDDLKPGPVSAATPQGFTNVETDPTDSIGDDVFVAPNLAAPAELIHCSRRNPARAINFPDCTDVFTWRDMVVRVTYRREHLRDWQRMRNAVTSYLTSQEAK